MLLQRRCSAPSRRPTTARRWSEALGPPAPTPRPSRTYSAPPAGSKRPAGRPGRPRCPHDLETVPDAISRDGVALEIVDLGRPTDDAPSIVAENVFHRAVAFGPWHSMLPPRADVWMFVNGDVHGGATASDDIADRVPAAARILAAMGEQLVAGDRLITGGVLQVRLEPGDEVLADMGPLGRLGVSIGPGR